MTVWFVPRDSAARSVGADEVAGALVDHGHTVVRTSSRGLLGSVYIRESGSRRYSAGGSPRDAAGVGCVCGRERERALLSF